MMEVHADIVSGAPPMSVQLLVCLGNPGHKYAQTRHNAGWQVAERLLEMRTWRRSDWQPGCGELYEWQSSSGRIYLLKPLTFMNDSGRAVNEVTGKLGFSPQEILVVCDCLDLPMGALRLRKRGSSGGQKGVESIIQILGTADFARLRIGIGRPEPGVEEIIDYVLSPWVSAEESKMAETFSAAASLVLTLVEEGWEAASSRSAIRSADNVNASKQGESEIGKV
ncbi:MAG: aminoacyl-tRNA hydrolase [Lentisphaerae bacterium]|jgi:PTH1 family peptidyl-tRNA hydrolase|nr:aminoacyl-tRNA hydrolase [Lentisphaerota bacterium]